MGTDAEGFAGGVFDGRYVYFVPYWNGTSYSGEVLRYDTKGEFLSSSSWSAYDPGANGVGTNVAGYWEAVFDGRYVYFVPDWVTGTGGEVLRYDTTSDFSNTSSWEAYKPSDHGIGINAVGYRGATFDGRYVYFAPYDNGIENHGEVLRYDTSSTFTSASAWAAYDPGANGVGSDPDGFIGAVFDGHYVYFVPHFNGNDFSLEVLRFDTTAAFNSASSWATFDAGSHGVGVDPAGYAGAVFDGRYVYFAPYEDGAGSGSEVLRFDTSRGFESVSSWATFDPGVNGVGTGSGAYFGAVFDGRFVYFAPNRDGSNYHGEVLRFDTFAGETVDCNANGIPDECDIESGFSEDCNRNGSPDECEPVLPSPPIADPFAVPRCRFLSVSLPPTPGVQYAIRVTLTSLHRVVPPYTGAPSIPFTAFEGQQRWVGPPAQYRESTANPTLFWGSTLQCTPYYQDWNTVGLVHVTGSEVVPSSVYDVQAFDISCQGSEDTCTVVSCSVEIKTSRWGDVETPYNPPSPTTQPDVGDISAVVNKFRSALGAPIKARTKLQPAIPDMSTDVDFRDIAMCVDAFRGLGYPFTISSCP